MIRVGKNRIEQETITMAKIAKAQKTKAKSKSVKRVVKAKPVASAKRSGSARRSAAKAVKPAAKRKAR